MYDYWLALLLVPAVGIGIAAAGVFILRVGSKLLLRYGAQRG